MLTATCIQVRSTMTSGVVRVWVSAPARPAGTAPRAAAAAERDVVGELAPAQFDDRRSGLDAVEIDPGFKRKAHREVGAKHRQRDMGGGAVEFPGCGPGQRRQPAGTPQEAWRIPCTVAAVRLSPSRTLWPQSWVSG